MKKTLEARLIETYMQSRNALAHRGKFVNKNDQPTEDSQTILKKLKMVEYMLYRFDYCLGLERAYLYAEDAKEQMRLLGTEKASM